MTTANASIQQNERTARRIGRLVSDITCISEKLSIILESIEVETTESEFSHLIFIAEAEFKKAKASREKTNARARARHSAMKSFGMKKSRDGSYE